MSDVQHDHVLRRAESGPCYARPFDAHYGNGDDAFCGREREDYIHSMCSPDCGKPHHPFLGKPFDQLDEQLINTQTDRDLYKIEDILSFVQVDYILGLIADEYFEGWPTYWADQRTYQERINEVLRDWAAECQTHRIKGNDD